MISGVVLHSLPAGYRFDLRRRERVGDRRRCTRCPAARPPRASDRRPAIAAAPARGGVHVARARRPAPHRAARATRAAAAAAQPARRRRPAGPRRPCASSRRASCAARTTGRASRSSGCSSTSASSRSSRPTRSRASPTRSSRCCRRSRTTPARSAGAAASSPGCATGRGSATSPSTSRSSSRTSPAPTSATARRAAPARYGQYNVIYEYREEEVGLEAGRMAVALVNHLVAPDDPDVFFDFAPELERLIRLAERQAFGPSTQALIDEAVSRDIPFIRLDRHSLVQLGHGVHQQRIRATMTSRTSAIGVDIASDKSLTNRLLDSAGLPVPAGRRRRHRGRRGRGGRSGSAIPCVVKPLDGNHGRGVHLDLRSEEEVRAAFHGALAQSRGGDVVVETYVAGNDYRCLVIGGKVAAIAERVPASRDGRRRAHRPPAGRHREQRPAARHRPREGPDPDQGRRGGRGARPRPGLRRSTTSCRPGVRVKLALTGNMSTGGTSIDRTIEAHPDNVEIAETAAQVVGPRRRRHRLHLPGHRDARPRDGRRDRRGQRRARLPDAHPPDRGRAAVRRPAGHRLALPGRGRRPASRSSP